MQTDQELTDQGSRNLSTLNLSTLCLNASMGKLQSHMDAAAFRMYVCFCMLWYPHPGELTLETESHSFFFPRSHQRNSTLLQLKLQSQQPMRLECVLCNDSWLDMLHSIGCCDLSEKAFTLFIWEYLGIHPCEGLYWQVSHASMCRLAHQCNFDSATAQTQPLFTIWHPCGSRCMQVHKGR